MPSDLDVEGVAAQIYTTECRGQPHVWWHALSGTIQDNYRRQARTQIICATQTGGLTMKGVVASA